MIPAAQQPVAALLARLAGAAPIETHVSAVFVGPDAALKLKKAVRLPFLDFTELAARERFVRRELEINRPFAPDLYRDVLPVTRAADGSLALAGAGEVVDWVLRMAPVPADDFLDAVAARGALGPELLDQVADAVAALHEALPPLAGEDAPAAMRAVLDGNRQSALSAGLPAARVEAWAAAAGATLARLSPLLAARAAAGRVRRCHGDLHLRNLCLWRGRVTPFDALEFDEALARTDTGYDLAFLLMDLECRLGRAAANRVLNRYIGRGGDAGLVGALPIWLSLRALVRAHVEAARGAAGLDYLALAEAVLQPAAPRLVAIGGLQGTGKSRLARALAPALGAAPGALVLRSDEIRKRRHGQAPEAPLPPAAYAPAESAAVFAELGRLAGEALRAGHAVIADAAFLRPEEREAIESVARDCGLPFTGLWLAAPLDVLRARIAARRGDASDATIAVLEAAAARELGPLRWQALDAAGDPIPAARALLRLRDQASC
ncbi:AAA family ATPase [Siccirubricoccus sp. G192]|uniref:bifunctional aminoglycoside phosphotransferase/ATP-binding protein n=1 Tax=Siccirubricoccus sp. G192 TaxID=2849651 RepID=UPI001C2CA4AC|nr:AAA family ATPase [Siccirubricoccus sp. G192]MBV1797158.1 AAA family ATPase [Siccirubricoccus sp. G192]